MMDQLISFADDVAATRVAVVLDKSSGKLTITADSAPGVIFDVSALRVSKGGIANDIQAIKTINKQLQKKNHVQ